MNTQKIIRALAYDAVFTFEYDVTTGLIEEDIIGQDGTNYMQKAGLSAPCSFNNLMDIYFGQEIGCRILSGSRIHKISNELLLDYYLSGKIRCEINIFYPITNAYYRILYFLYEDEMNGHVRAFAAGMNGHIAKPIDISRLLETLFDILSLEKEGR